MTFGLLWASRTQTRVVHPSKKLLFKVLLTPQEYVNYRKVASNNAGLYIIRISTLIGLMMKIFSETSPKGILASKCNVGSRKIHIISKFRDF